MYNGVVCNAQFIEFGEQFAKSSNEQLAGLGRMLQGSGRRADLVGKEMKIEGTTMDGDAFDWTSYRGKVVLVDFWAPWCGPCLAMAPAFEEAAAQLEPEIRLAKLNTDDEQAVGGRFGIRSIPTMILFHGGQEIARHSGAMMAGDIIRWVENQLSAG